MKSSYFVVILVGVSAAVLLITYLESTGIDVHSSFSGAASGYWTPHSGNVDWCEANYVFSDFIAEFWNTLTSGYIAALGLISLYSLDSRHDEYRMYFLSTSLVVVGVGSVLFHATLSYFGQVMDELPMLLSILGNLWCLFTLKSKKLSLLLMVSFFASFISILALYLAYPDNPAPFQLVFSLLTLVVIIWSLISHASKESKAVLTLSFLSYMTGAVLWVSEPVLCKHVPYLQLHSWWHILAGTGGYLYIQYAKHQRYEAVGKRPKVTHTFSLPVVQVV